MVLSVVDRDLSSVLMTFFVFVSVGVVWRIPVLHHVVCSFLVLRSEADFVLPVIGLMTLSAKILQCVDLLRCKIT